MPPLANTALAASIALSALGAVIVCLLTVFFGFTPDGEEAPGSANRRRLLTRMGHAVAVACFAGTAILLAVVLAQASRAVPASSGDARLPALDTKLDAQVLRLQGVEQRMKDSEETLQRLETEVSDATARRMAPEPLPAVSEHPKPEEPLRAVSTVKPAPRARAAIVPARPPAKAAPPAAKPAARPVAAPAIAPPPTITPVERVAPAPSDEPAASPPAPPVTTAPPVTPPPPAPSRPSSSAPPPSAAPMATSARESSNGLRSKFLSDWRAIQRGWDGAGDDFRRAIAPLRGEN